MLDQPLTAPSYKSVMLDQPLTAPSYKTIILDQPLTTPFHKIFMYDPPLNSHRPLLQERHAALRPQSQLQDPLLQE